MEEHFGFFGLIQMESGSGSSSTRPFGEYVSFVVFLETLGPVPVQRLMMNEFRMISMLSGCFLFSNLEEFLGQGKNVNFSFSLSQDTLG